MSWAAKGSFAAICRLRIRSERRIEVMAQEHDIPTLRSRIAELVHQEGVLVSEALQHSRGGDRQRVDDLYMQLHALQLDRTSIQQRIAALLGPRRMHVASEVWRPGEYDYCLEVGGASARIRVVQHQFGLHAIFPGRDQPIAVETLKGTFDGPVASGGAGSAPHADDGAKARSRRAQGVPPITTTGPAGSRKRRE